VTTTGTRWLSADEQVAWRAYYEILVQLSEAPDRRLRMSQLAEETAASKSRISHAVARLEERGWVRRIQCPTDRRGAFAELTEEGYAALVAAAPGHVEQVRSTLLDPLTAGQVRQLQEISEAIQAAVGDLPRGAISCP